MMKKTPPAIDCKATGENLRWIMLIRRISVKEVQEYLRLGSLQSIYHWLEGKCLPSLDNLYALSELLCVPMDLLIVGDRDNMSIHQRRNLRLMKYRYSIQAFSAA